MTASWITRLGPGAEVIAAALDAQGVQYPNASTELIMCRLAAAGLAIVKATDTPTTTGETPRRQGLNTNG